MSYQNYYGVWLPDTAAASNWINGAPGATVYGTGQNDQIGSGGQGAVLIGGAGDDFYWLKDGSETVVEQPGQGTDTIEVWQSYALPANVENLIVFGNGQFATGNSQDNIIQATGSGDTLYGGFGSDVLVGSPGAGDTYLVVQGQGAKAIQGFEPGQYSADLIRLANSPLHTFAQVQAAMTQVGPDVVINDGGEPLVIRNTQIGQFAANNFQLPLDTSGLGAPTFDDEFNSLQWADPSKGYGGSTGWWPSFGAAAQGNVNDYTLTRNNEQQIYTSPFFTGSSGVSPGLDPFSVNNGVLSISATPVNSWQSQQMWGYQYSSGAITTEWSHLQTYGYFEMRAQLPTGAGTWPAFWLESGGAEIDVLEAVGAEPNEASVGYHSPAGGDHTVGVELTPTSDGYHTFGVLWSPTDLIYYIDGNEVLDTPTPSDLNRPMWMIANLAIGGGWAGSPNSSTAWPETMNIDYIRAYNLPGQGGGQTSSAPPPPPPPPPSSGSGSGSGSSGQGAAGAGGQVYVSAASYTAPDGVTAISLDGSAQTVAGNNAGDVFYSNDTGNHLIGGSGADTFYIGRGGDTVTGGGGADKFVFDANPWNGGHITDFNAADQIDFSTTLGKAGYYGSDPVGAGYMKIASDGAGDAQVWIDPNGSFGAADGWWLATTLDGVAASSLHVNGGIVTTDASGGASSPGGAASVVTAAQTYVAPAGVTSITLSGAGQTVTGNDLGDTFHSDSNGANHLIGGAGNDTFYIGRAGDTVTGGGGADTFVFEENPWNGGHITDFNPWQDKIDLTPTLAKAGYGGSDPIGTGFVKIDSDAGGNARIWIDPNGSYGAANGWWLATTLDGVAPSSIHEHGDLFYA